MSIEEAITILDPETSKKAIDKINQETGFDSDKVLEQINIACIMACHILGEHLSNKESYNVSYDDLKRLSKEELIELILKSKVGDEINV